MPKIYLSPKDQQETAYANDSTINGRKLWKAQRTIEGRLETAEFKITPEAIVATVTSSDEYTSLESVVSQTASDITLKVSKNDVINQINLSTEGIVISAAKINLSGYVTFTNLSTSGQTSINGGNIITSSISADKLSVSSLSAISANVGTLTTGTIGNWTVGSNLTRNGITLGNDAITFTNNGTGGSTINFNSAKIYNNSGSSAIGVSGNFLVDSNLYVLGTAIVDDIRPSTSGIALGASGYRWGMIYADTLWCNVVGSSTIAAERPNVYAGTMGATFGGTFYYLTRDSNGFVKAV